MNSLILINEHLLNQAISLIRDPAPGQYTRPCEAVFSSSIGQHVRHCVEHYEEFLGAMRENRDLNYENRPRDPDVETDSAEAVRRLERIRESLKKHAMRCREMGVWDTGAITAAPSSASREMQYLVSHTVHHFALISIIAKLGGMPVPEGFGVAPSTLKFRESA